MGTQQLDFSDLEPQTVSFECQGQSYVLHEATGGVAKRFNNERAKRVKYGPSGNVSQIGDIGDLEPLLVSLCLKTAAGDNIPVTVIEKWPSRMVKKLYETVEEISGLKEPNAAFSQLIDALESPESPITPEDFCSWVRSLSDEGYKALKAEVAEIDKEETVKE